MKGTDMRKRFRENWKILSAAAAGVLVMILAVLLPPGKTAIGKIQRDTYGGAVKTVTLYVQTDGEEEQAVEIQVSPRKYSRTELEALAGQAARRLDTVLPGENKSLDYVVSDLVLPGSLEGLPFRITWELSRYDVLDMEGKIQEEELEKEDTDDGGVLVTLTGILRYEDFETAYSTSARICKPEEKNQNFSELVQSVIQKEDEASSENAWLVLPKEIEGKKIICGACRRYPASVRAAAPAAEKTEAEGPGEGERKTDASGLSGNHQSGDHAASDRNDRKKCMETRDRGLSGTEKEERKRAGGLRGDGDCLERDAGRYA